MIPKSCKRLAEVDFPIAAVSKHSIREKPVVSKHPQSFHQWWARRPLASCRAMLMALLLPDPADPYCPGDFKEKAREILPQVAGKIGNTDLDLRGELLRFIADLANWDNSSNRKYIDVARGLVKAAHPEETPLVVDPFAGGGSIPLEALRLGCDAFASDLNPVACLILKVMLEDIPRHDPELADELRRVGEEIKVKAIEEFKEFYPVDPDGSKPIAYLWARTVRCEEPNCGAEIPLMRSMWLCKKPNRKFALKPKVIRPKPGEKDAPPQVEFEIFKPKSEKEVRSGTVARGNASCLCCGSVLPVERVRPQMRAQDGGADVIFDKSGNRIGGARMLAVVTLTPGEQGRHYRLPNESDYKAVWSAQKRLCQVLEDWERGGKIGLCPVPDEPLPPIGTLGFRVQRYGMMKWGDLFTARQKVFLSFVSHLVSINPSRCTSKDLLALIVSRLANRHASLLVWDIGGEKLGQVFSRQALPVVWDFVEGSPIANTTGSIANVLHQIEGAINSIQGLQNSGSISLQDATNNSLPSESSSITFTDPPYYDAVPYADLSDFFFVWLKRSLPDHPLLKDPFNPENVLTPKTREVIQDEIAVSVGGLPKNREFYEHAMAMAFADIRRVLKEDGIGSVVFAHKTTEGWEALLSGLVKGGLTITASWPIATERPGRLRARDSAALATSVHLVIRPRPDDAGVGDWGDVLRDLTPRVRSWMDRLEAEGVRGADLVFACIGPALEVFSRYEKVETAEGSEVTLAEFLEKVWEAVGKAALEKVLGTADSRTGGDPVGALEEDARLTALFLWALKSTNGGNGVGQASSLSPSDDGSGGESEDDDDSDDVGKPKKKKGLTLIFDVVRRFAQPLGIDLPRWEGRVIETKKGIVRLLPVSERARQLFGEEGARTVADWLESEQRRGVTEYLFPDLDPAAAKGRILRRRCAGGELNAEHSREKVVTTLDRVHTAMLFQAGGMTNALRSLIMEERERGQDFLRLANALSALYPVGSEEKRLLDAMLLSVPR